VKHLARLKATSASTVYAVCAEAANAGVTVCDDTHAHIDTVLRDSTVAEDSVDLVTCALRDLEMDVVSIQTCLRQEDMLEERLRAKARNMGRKVTGLVHALRVATLFVADGRDAPEGGRYVFTTPAVNGITRLILLNLYFEGKTPKAQLAMDPAADYVDTAGRGGHPIHRWVFAQATR
jgi:hypothetical protein